MSGSTYLNDIPIRPFTSRLYPCHRNIAGHDQIFRLRRLTSGRKRPKWHAEFRLKLVWVRNIPKKLSSDLAILDCAYSNARECYQRRAGKTWVIKITAQSSVPFVTLLPFPILQPPITFLRWLRTVLFLIRSYRRRLLCASHWYFLAYRMNAVLNH